jgi:hypothetical protein
MTFATVDLPDPVPPAMPMTSGGVRFGMLELYWNTGTGGSEDWLLIALNGNWIWVGEPPKGIEPLT